MSMEIIGMGDAITVEVTKATASMGGLDIIVLLIFLYGLVMFFWQGFKLIKKLVKEKK